MNKTEIDRNKLLNLKQQIQRKYDFAYPSDNLKNFYIGIADYVSVIESSDYLQAIVVYAILEKRNNLNKRIDELTKQVVDEVKKSFEDVLKMIDENKLEDQRITNELNDYTGFVEGRIHISGYGNYGTYLSDQVRDVILAVEASGYKDKIKDYGIYDQNGNRTGWKISKSEQELDGLLARRREEKETSVWGAWEDIWQIYDAIYNKFDRWDQVSKTDNFLDKVSYGSYYGKIKEILEDKGKANNYYPFDVQEYKRHLFRVNEVLQTEIEGLLPSAVETKSESRAESKFEYDHEGAMLHYDGNLVFSLHRGKGKSKMFKALWDSKRVVLNGSTIEKGKPALLRKDLKNISGSKSTNSDNIDKAMAYFRTKLRGFPADLIAEKGFRLVLRG